MTEFSVIIKHAKRMCSTEGGHKMTNDLISRSALLKNAIRVSELDEGGWERILRAVPVEDIEAAEAVSVPEIVHCRECRHYEGYVGCGYCNKHQCCLQADDFCSRGDRVV